MGEGLSTMLELTKNLVLSGILSANVDKVELRLTFSEAVLWIFFI